MSNGYFIGLGDKTTCGGKVLDGDSRFSFHGLLHACEGDRVTCGKTGQVYTILGGISHMSSHGRRMAGTLDSFSSCPCRASLIPSVFTASYSNEGYPSQPVKRAAQPVPPTQTNRPVAPHQSSYTPPNNPAPFTFTDARGEEPGFYVVPKSMTREALEAMLFPTPDAYVMHKFRALNPNIGDVKAGSMIVLSDPNNFQCSREEGRLMKAAALSNDALSFLSEDEADFMQLHREEIESFLTQGSTAIGAGEAMFARNLDDLEKTFQEIEALHQKAFLKDGHLRSTEFFSERKRLLSQLDTHLTSLIRKGTGLSDHPKLKSALGISSRSLVHRWTQAGAPGQIPGYATHIQEIAKTAKIIKYGGWVGTAIGGGASYMKVQDVCSAGNAEACERIRFTQTGSFIGAAGGGAFAAAALSSAVVGGLCVALGVPTVGAATLACGLIVVGAGSTAGGLLGEAAGEWTGEKIYESLK